MNLTKFLAAAVLACGPLAVMASPGNDGCVGNCANTQPTVSAPSNLSATSNAASNAAASANATGVAVVNSRNVNRNSQGQEQNQSQTANGGTGVGIGVGGNASATGGNAFNGGVTVTTNEARQVGVAPNVSSFPTANCRVTGGASAGWLGGAFGFSGSVVDETCETIEVSKQLNHLGMTEAAVQSMCLVEKARKALEATGVKCKIGQPEAAPVETVRP